MNIGRALGGKKYMFIMQGLFGKRLYGMYTRACVKACMCVYLLGVCVFVPVVVRCVLCLCACKRIRSREIWNITRA